MATGNGSKQNVEYVIPALENLLPQYDLIRDAIAGSTAIKAKGPVYLPMPNAHDTSAANVERYRSYITRAVFYNVTKRTLSGLTGQVMLIDPVIEVPTMLDPMVKDVNGSGVTLVQQSEQTLRFVLAYGRAGLLSDFPVKDPNKPTTRKDQLDGSVRPTISLYAPWDIINWRTTLAGSRRLLTLVVLRETYVEDDDGFEEKINTQYRVLRLVNGIYHVEVWREASKGAGFGVYSAAQPTDAAGNLLDEIPFMFVGVHNNDSIPDDPPLFDLADINIGHYRNSADYEESCFIVGQPTPYVTGVTDRWIKDVFGGELNFGSRGGIPLPEGGAAGLIQMQPNSAAFEAMGHKERQMVALGAKLVEQKTVQRSATEAGQDAAAEASTLTTATKNVSKAYVWTLEWGAIFSGATTIDRDAKESVIKFELNTKFDFASMTPEQVRMAIEMWQKGATTFSEMREYVRRAGYATLDDEQAREDIDSETPSGNDNIDPDEIPDDENDENDNGDE